MQCLLLLPLVLALAVGRGCAQALGPSLTAGCSIAVTSSSGGVANIVDGDVNTAWQSGANFPTGEGGWMGGAPVVLMG